MSKQDLVSRRTILRTSGAGMGGLTLAGCLGGNGGGDDGAGSLNLGMLMPLSGPYAGAGENTIDAVRLGIKQYEENNDRTINLFTGDTKTDPSEATKALNDLHNSEDLDIIMGGLSSAVQISMATWAQRNDLLYMAQAGSMAMTGEKCRPNMYNFAPSLAQQQSPLYHIGENDLGSSVFHIYADYTTGQSHQSWLEDYTSSKYNLDLAGSAAVPLDATDLSSYMSQARDSGADVLFCMAYQTPQVRMLKQADEFGLTEDMLLAAPIVTTFTASQVPQRVLAEAIMGSSWYWDMPNVSEAVEFSEAYISEYDTWPQSTAATSYTGFMTAMKAINEVGSTNPGDLRSTLEGAEVTPQLWGTGEFIRECDHQMMAPNPVIQGLSPDEADRDNGKFFEILSTEEKPERHWPSCSERGCNMSG